MGRCNKCLPKKFLCYSLRCGAYVVGIIMFCLTLGMSLGLVAQSVIVKNCKNCEKNQWRQMYSYSIVACVDGFFMTLVNMFLIWGIKKEKPSVVLSWVVIAGIGLVQTVALTVVLFCIYGSEVKSIIAWVSVVVCIIIGLCIAIYGILVVYAHWLELKTLQERPVPPVAVNLSRNSNSNK